MNIEIKTIVSKIFQISTKPIAYILLYIPVFIQKGIALSSKKTIKQCPSFITMDFPFKISFYILFFPHIITYLAIMKEYIYNYFILLQTNSFHLFQSLFYTNRMIFSYNDLAFLFRHRGDLHK